MNNSKLFGAARSRTTPQGAAVTGSVAFYMHNQRLDNIGVNYLAWRSYLNICSIFHTLFAVRKDNGITIVRQSPDVMQCVCRLDRQEPGNTLHRTVSV
jgi:hypothetical protein